MSNSNEELLKNEAKNIITGNTIFACIDGSSVSEAVCDYSSWIARVANRPLKLIHAIKNNHNAVVSDYSGAIGLGSQQDLLNELTEVEQSRASLLIKKGQLMLNAAKALVMNNGVEKVETYQHHGNLAESLVELQEDIRITVIGIRGKEHDLHKQGIGHQLESVIRSLHKPILVVNKEFSEPKKAMLAYDGSPSCIKALNMVASSKLFKNIPCHLVHVGNKGGSILDEAAKTLTDVGIQVTSVQLEGEVEEALVNYQLQNDIEITLMGAYSHNKFRDLLLGSLTAKMLATTHTPLLLLR